MAIRISCPSCDASLSFDDAKRGKKVTCKKCDESFTVPSANGKAKAESSAIQNGRKIKAKSSARDDDDEDDERPAKKKSKPEPKKSGLVLILAGVGVVLFLVCGGIAGVGALLVHRARQAVGEIPIAEFKDAMEKKGDLDRKKDGEPKKDGELKKDPPKMDPDPKSGPPALSAELQRVKQATVYLSAQLPGGGRSEGSGFLAFEPGLVVTNAHVLGIVDPNAPPPTTIEATLNPGEPNQAKMPATLLGFDPKLDLAVLRVTSPALPAPLPLEDSARIAQALPVQIASHPVELNMRRPFTFTPTTISMLKKSPAGNVDELQVGAGIGRANSGGPVVTPAGMVVGIAGNDPQARRATSGDLIKRFLSGSVGDATIGNVVKAGPDTKAPVSYPLIDPLQRIKEARIEVWSGAPGANRPASLAQPAPLPGDGARKAIPLGLLKNTASGDAVLPVSMPPGQVVWLQPVIVLKDNTTQWGVATSIMPPTPSPYDLRPANLTIKLYDPKDRTATINATFSSATAKKKTVTRINVSVLEHMEAGPNNTAQMKTAFGYLTSSVETDGQNFQTPKTTFDLVRPLAPTYNVGSANQIANRLYRQLDLKLPKEASDPAVKLQYQIATAFESGFLSMPNKTVKPGETFQTMANIKILVKGKTQSAILDLVGTYEGFLNRNSRTEAIVTVKGKLNGLGDPDLRRYEGPVTGTIGFDESAGYISSTQLKIGNAGLNNVTIDLDVKRTSGNTGNIQLVQDTPTPPNPMDPNPKNKTKTLFDQKGTMVATGNFDPQFSDAKKKRFAHKQDIPFKMEMGKTYTIQVTNAAFDSYLKLSGPPGLVAQGGGAGNSSKLTYRAPITGLFVLSVISHNGRTGGYHLKIQESP
ncbi:MAG TPA: trypsin-like peptidase domain-containing protein [Gemmataceae bacterium]|nr:trypsin-like peptidase domain-containing protein [Gemmataceae bacterium]